MERLPRRRGGTPHSLAIRDMARRSRRFESLEQRQLLAAAHDAADVAALIASPAPSVPPQMAISGGDGASSDAGSAAADASEYAATKYASTEYAATTAADSASGGRRSYYSEYAAAGGNLGPGDKSSDSGAKDDYSSAASNPASPLSPATSSNPTNLAVVLQLSQTSEAATPPADAHAAVLSVGAAVSLTAAGAPGGPAPFDARDLVARGDWEEPVSGPAAAVLLRQAAELVAPVAWAMSGEYRTVDSFDAEAGAPSNGPTRRLAESSAAGLIAGAVGADWSAFERGIDELLERIARAGEELPDASTAWHVGECVGLAAGAAAAFEYVRAQLREGGGWQIFADAGREPWEPRLRRRWFRRRSERKTHA